MCFHELFDHYYMERLDFCALIKHIFKTDLQKDKILCAKDFISCHMQTLALKYSPEIQYKKINISGLKIKALDL